MMDEVKRGGMAARSAWEISLEGLVTGLVINYVWIVAVCLSKVDTINSRTLNSQQTYYQNFEV